MTAKKRIELDLPEEGLMSCEICPYLGECYIDGDEDEGEFICPYPLKKEGDELNVR